MSKTVTIRLHDRRWFRREIKRLELEYDEVFDAATVDVHGDIIRAALNNPELILEQLQNCDRD